MKKLVPWNKGKRGEYSVNALEKNPRWCGNEVSEEAGRKRARRRISLDKRACSICGSIPVERHHIDGNTLNNHDNNILIVCRKCHMKVDGRLEKISNYTKGKGQTNNGGWVTCSTCGRKYRDKINREAILGGIECLNCDHVRGEVMDDQLTEMARDEGYASYKDYQEAEGLI